MRTVLSLIKQTEDLTTEETHLLTIVNIPQGLKRKGNEEHTRDTHQQLPIQLNTAPSRCEMFLYLNFSRHEFSFQDTCFQIIFFQDIFLDMSTPYKSNYGSSFFTNS